MALSEIWTSVAGKAQGAYILTVMGFPPHHRFPPYRNREAPVQSPRGRGFFFGLHPLKSTTPSLG